MKKIFSILLAVTLCFSLSLTSFAIRETTTADENFTITTEDGLLTTETTQEEIGALSALPKPYDIEFTQLDGIPIIIKHYILEPALNTSTLFLEKEEIGKATYTRYEVLENKQPPIRKVKTVTVPIHLSSETDNKSDIVAEFPQTMEYNEGGFMGTLTLNTDSLVTKIAGTTPYIYPTRTTKEFAGLDRADLNYIPKMLNGAALVGVTWTSLGGVQHGDILAPSHYTATAIYGGTGTGSKATDYDSTAFYEGEVSQQTPSQSFYKVIYLKEGNPYVFALEMAKIITVLLVAFAILKITTNAFKTYKKGEKHYEKN